MNARNHAAAEISRAVSADRRGDAAGRNQIVSRLRADSDLPQRALLALLKKSGLTK